MTTQTMRAGKNRYDKCARAVHSSAKAPSGALTPDDDALPVAAPGSALGASAPCSCLSSSTARRSSLLSCRAFVRKRLLRFCAFFSCCAKRLRSARMRACCALMSAMVVDKDCISEPPSADDALNCVPMAATWLSAALLAAEADAGALEAALALPVLDMAVNLPPERRSEGTTALLPALGPRRHFWSALALSAEAKTRAGNLVCLD